MIKTYKEKHTWYSLAIVLAVALSFLTFFSLITFDVKKTFLAIACIPISYFFIMSESKERLLLFGIILLFPVLELDIPPRRLEISLFDVLVVILILLTIFQVTIKKRPFSWEKNAFSYPMLCLLLSALVSTMLSKDPFISFYELVRNLKFWAFYVIFIDMIKDKNDLKLAYSLFLLGFAASVFLGMGQHFLKIGLKLSQSAQAHANTKFTFAGVTYRRTMGTFPESILFAQYLLVPLFVLLGMIFYEKRLIRQGLFSLLFLAGTLTLFLTITRGAILAYLLILMIFLAVELNYRQLTFISFICIFAIATVIAYPELVAMLAPTWLVGRFKMMGHDIFYGRALFWTASISIWGNYPLFGVGFRNLLYFLPLYAPSILWDPFFLKSKGLASASTLSLGHVHVDNVYLTFLTEIGLVGLSIFLFIMGRAGLLIYSLYRKIQDPELKGLAIGICGGFAAFACNMVTTYGYSDDRLALMLWFLLGSMVVMNSLCSQQQQSLHLPATPNYK